MQASEHNPNKKFYGDFASHQPINSPDDNVERLCEVFRVGSEW